MIRSAKILFCSNEHGCGDITFPSISALDTQSFIEPKTTKQLRREARQAGWKRIKGADYCDICVEGGCTS